MPHQQAAPHRRPLVIGEVLFDQFPDGQQILGGAPFNVAWNLQALGSRPMFTSTVGNDDLATQVEQRMDQWRMPRNLLQRHDSLPTGRVTVFEEGDGPGYEIAENQAFDHTGHQPIGEKNTGMIYHGSLAWRSDVSRETICRHRREIDAPVFVDINIREPWFDPAWLPELLLGVSWLKLNRAELAQITGGKISNDQELARAIEIIREKYGCQNFFITDGDQGAYSFDTDNQLDFAPAPTVNAIADTVGAGDAFTAFAIHGLLAGWSTQEILRNAVDFAARICTIRGATSQDSELYRL